MATDHKKGYEEVMANMGALGENCPGVMKSFMGLHDEALKEGALSTKEKELISLGIAIAVRCTGCIQCHVKAALDAGASREEIAETVGVAVLMAGGPGTVYGGMALEALEQFLAE